MGLEIHTMEQQRREAASGTALVADRELAVMADEKTVVDGNDARARFVLCGQGSTISVADVKRLGLSMVDGKIVQHAKESPKVQEPPKPDADATRRAAIRAEVVAEFGGEPDADDEVAKSMINEEVDTRMQKEKPRPADKQRKPSENKSGAKAK